MRSLLRLVRRYWVELAWFLFAAVNLAVTVTLANFETVPFHFVWVSLTLVYGWRVWKLQNVLLTLGFVCVSTGATLGYVVNATPRGLDELTEVPLMAAMFLAMVWHALRREAALDALATTADRQREFVRDASHQLKTPIAVARAIAGLLRDAPAAERSDEDISDLVEELDRLGQIAEDLLLLAGTRGAEDLLIGPTDFEDLTVDLARRWSRAADRRWWVAASPEGLLHCDRYQLDAALDAVLENAVNATKAGDSIDIVARSEGTNAIIEIHDHGVGIPPDSIERVFDRFWSTPYATDGKRGTGLGLAIVKAIVEAHGGEVSLRSQPGRGTIVALRLPNLEPSGSAAAIDPRVPSVLA
jgi:two-component system, OmpR family, sensor kinase